MEQSSNNFPISFDNSHSIRWPKPVEDVFVQTSDLKRLRWHIDRIEIPSLSYDWPSAVIGAAASLAIPFATDWIKNKTPSVIYLGLFVFFAALFSLSLINRNKKLKESNPRQYLEEARQDIKTIYERANLSYSNQYDHATVSASSDHMH